MPFFNDMFCDLLLVIWWLDTWPFEKIAWEPVSSKNDTIEWVLGKARQCSKVNYGELRRWASNSVMVWVCAHQHTLSCFRSWPSPGFASSFPNSASTRDRLRLRRVLWSWPRWALFAPSTWSKWFMWMISHIDITSSMRRSCYGLLDNYKISRGLRLALTTHTMPCSAGEEKTEEGTLLL